MAGLCVLEGEGSRCVLGSLIGRGGGVVVEGACEKAARVDGYFGNLWVGGRRRTMSWDRG